MTHHTSKFRITAALAALVLGGAVALADPSVYEPGVDPGLGFNMISWWNDPNGEALWAGAVQEVHDAGFRHVSISPVRYFDTTTGAIAATSAKGPELSHIAAGIARATSLNMSVTVNPFVEPADFTEWRGYWDPTPGGAVSNQFWSDYGQYLADVAAVAQAGGADRMTVGTELRALTRNTGHQASWSSAISAADAAFAGSLGYAANWDNYNHPSVTAAVWDHTAIDFIGIDAYFPLATNGQADASGAFPGDTAFIATVESSWDNLLDSAILPFAGARKGGAGMPVIFTEHGLIPYNRTTTRPYDESFATGGQPVDQDERLAGYRGLINAIDGRAAADDEKLLEVHLWQWGMPGAAESFWYTHTDAVNENAGQPWDRFDESLGNPVGQFLSDYVNTAPAISGDANGDGCVDDLDLTALAVHWQQATNLWDHGDFNGDGIVDDLDLTALAVNWQQGCGGGGSLADAWAYAQENVPEPGFVGLMLLISLGLTYRRRA